MKTMFLFCVVNLFIVFQFGMAQIAIKTQSKPDILYLFVFNVTDSSFETYDILTDQSISYPITNNTVLKMLDGTLHTPTKSKIETHGGYKFTFFSESNNANADTLEQVFMLGSISFNSELCFGILNSTSDNSKIKKLDNTEIDFPIFSSTLYYPFYSELTSDWFSKNIGTYLFYGTRFYSFDNKTVIGYRKLPNNKIQNFKGKISLINGKEFIIFGKSVFISPSTKFYDSFGNSLILDDFSVNDIIDIDFTHYDIESQNDYYKATNINKYIALRITKLPHKEEINRYSEDVIKVSNDTIYTTSHFLKLSSVQSKKDVNGDDITTDSLFAHYRAVTFEVSSNENRNEIRNVDFLHVTFNQKDSLHYRGTAIGRINSIQFPNLSVGANQYIVANDAKIRNKFGDSTIANETTIPNNALVKLFYSRVENGNTIDFVVNFIALEDTSTFSSVFEPKANVLSVFPNPITNDQTMIEFESDVDEMIQLNIVSINGKTIQSQNVNVNNGINTIITNLKSIPNGQYFLEIVSSNNKKRYSTPIQLMR
ncbi:MAG: T9SS type A sorting domain-containing protein [Candidatus Kapabacteria bacterium]|nr:T9SS type A sorting domain-containing protein [Candidatus Kapabacteria bacterium]